MTMQLLSLQIQLRKEAVLQEYSHVVDLAFSGVIDLKKKMVVMNAEKVQIVFPSK